jgi:hypothetical protein
MTHLDGSFSKLLISRPPCVEAPGLDRWIVVG